MKEATMDRSEKLTEKPIEAQTEKEASKVVQPKQMQPEEKPQGKQGIIFERQGDAVGKEYHETIYWDSRHSFLIYLDKFREIIYHCNMIKGRLNRKYIRKKNDSPKN